MKDILKELDAVRRETGTAANGRTAILRRSYDADMPDVWDALTNPGRIKRWFMPVSGDLKLGGRFQAEGNAGGEILACEPPRYFKVSWVFGESPAFSEVEVRLREGESGETIFELLHTAEVPEEMWSQFGPGAVGVGWDGALLGLALHLRGVDLDSAEKEAWPFSDEGREFNTRSAEAWGFAFAASGASDEQVAAATTATIGFYVPELPTQS